MITGIIMITASAMAAVGIATFADLSAAAVEEEAASDGVTLSTRSPRRIGIAYLERSAASSVTWFCLAL
jgi:hypothetical protein